LLNVSATDIVFVMVNYMTYKMTRLSIQGYKVV